MLAEKLYERLKDPEFYPFTIVLANGENIPVTHPDSVSMATTTIQGRRFFSPSVTVLETRGDTVIEHAISMPMIAKVVRQFGMNGNGTH